MEAEAFDNGEGDGPDAGGGWVFFVEVFVEPGEALDEGLSSGDARVTSKTGNMVNLAKIFL